MPVKRICKCGKAFQSFGSIICSDCTRWNAYICSHPQLEQKAITILPELRFFFHRTAVSDLFQTVDTALSGCFRIDSKDKTKWSIHIYLFSYSIMDSDLIKQIGITISHEYLHKCIGIDASESSAVNSMADSSGLMTRLKDGGYFGF